MPAPSTGNPTVNSKWRVDVDTDISGYTGSWAQLKGMSNFVPALASTIQDATDYDTDGWGADAVTARKHNSTGTVLRKKYTGAFDPAQELLRAAADDNTLIHVRWYARETGDEAYEGYVLVQWEPQGGDAPGLAAVNFTLLGQGPRTAITNPYTGAAVVPTVNSVSPNTGAAAGGTLVTINGSGFALVTGATGVKFGADNATSYNVISDSTISAVAPPHAAGLVQVIVTNPTGPSVNTAGDDYTYV